MSAAIDQLYRRVVIPLGLMIFLPLVALGAIHQTTYYLSQLQPLIEEMALSLAGWSTYHFDTWTDYDLVTWTTYSFEGGWDRGFFDGGHERGFFDGGWQLVREVHSATSAVIDSIAAFLNVSAEYLPLILIAPAFWCFTLGLPQLWQRPIKRASRLLLARAAYFRLRHFTDQFLAWLTGLFKAADPEPVRQPRTEETPTEIVSVKLREFLVIRRIGSITAA